MISDSTTFAFLLFVFVSFVGFDRTVSIHQTRSTCQSFQKKLNQYSIQMKYQPDQIFTPLRLCPSSNNTCCPQTAADLIENATVIELYQLFELYSMNIYEPLLRIRQNFNKTFVLLIEYSRNETHQVLQRGYHQLYISYRSIVDRFFHHLRQLNSRSYREDLSLHVEQLFQDILRTSLTFNQNQTFVLPSYLSCLWKNQPFGSSPTLFINQLEIIFNKLFQLNDLFKLSHELVQVISSSVTTDYHCIESYLQLSFCNLCHGKDELPCQENCRRVMETCLINGTLIDDIWQEFIDSTSNFDYFHGIEKTFSSIGLSISEAVMTFLNSGGVQNKDIINQCGRLRTRRQTFALETHVNNDQDDQKRSFFDQQLSEWSQSLQRHRLFWKQLPEQICRINGVSTDKQRSCWSATSLDEDQKSIYEKPLNLKLQWILKELREKSRLIGSMMRRTLTSALTSTTMISTTRSSSQIKTSADLDDYPTDNEFDYSDYAYEDATEQSTTTTTTTTSSSSTMMTTTTTTTTIDDSSIDESQTSFYDYGDHDLYSDDEIEETTSIITTTETTTIFSTTTPPHWRDRIPYYHRRKPIIWNIQYQEDDLETTHQNQNSASRIYSRFSILLLIFVIRV